MAETHIVTTSDQRPEIERLVRDLPAILSGGIADERGIGLGFRSRIGHALLSLIAPNFEEMSRGQPGADGTKWPPLKRETIAYGRRLGPTERAQLRKQHGVTPQHRHGPGDTKGLLTSDQLKLWKRTFARYYAKFVMRESDGAAKAHAAAVAWVVIKKAGGKTKLQVYGDRQVQILVDTGRGANSLQAGYLNERGPEATYESKAPGDQAAEFSEPGRAVVGTNVGYMGAHHRGVPGRLPQRRLWPAELPAEWWRQVLTVAVSGLVRIGELFGGPSSG